MENDILISPIIIYSKGDESAGIFSQRWEIIGDIFIYPEDRETFREKLKIAWEYVTDDVVDIMFMDEFVDDFDGEI